MPTLTIPRAGNLLGEEQALSPMQRPQERSRAGAASMQRAIDNDRLRWLKTSRSTGKTRAFQAAEAQTEISPHCRRLHGAHRLGPMLSTRRWPSGAAGESGAVPAWAGGHGHGTGSTLPGRRDRRLPNEHHEAKPVARTLGFMYHWL
ncbi:hypothetical protein ACU4GD_35000 [Cupriavidus basilensis]